jgi:hypothetical protein
MLAIAAAAPQPGILAAAPAVTAYAAAPAVAAIATPPLISSVPVLSTGYHITYNVEPVEQHGYKIVY